MSSRVRESNMELLRIVSMLLIIIFHYVFNSNFQYSELTINNLLIESCWFLGELGVNVFILITGYYLCKSSFSLKKIILIICEVFFYNILNVIIGIRIGAISSFGDIGYVFPIMTEKYWFITSYLLIYVLSPYFNKLIGLFKKNEYQKFLIIILGIWCVIPTIFGFFYNTSEILLFYNRFIWLSIMYFVGAYIRIYNIKCLDTKKKCIITYAVTLFIMVLSIVFINNFNDYFTRIGTTKAVYFWTPNNILMLIFSLSFFVFFTKLKIKNNKVINMVASTTLGIYLLHDGVIKKYVWKNYFKSNIYICSNNWYVYLLGTTVLIFVVGFVVDIIRQFLEKYIIKKYIDLSIWEDVYIRLKKEVRKFINKFI